ncbi:paired immunoglobulin-like type 2 receptor beta isoform X2 [Sparus aurata]|nr:paired immunoglobulin-like type 2 receptor beta isoform X2 [Sparus aurata]XP_030249236.1 paired immunoglobulin-like type 2 receptor beta isoform X2 [Sparus aurata]XP_030249237.1 paired immunoglobulin-like type 2 receptor beta isoform X2 [Sparus aurata]
MKLPGLIGAGLILILASPSKGQEWNVNVTRHIKATLGKDVTIPCTFTYPPKLHTDNIKVYWKKMKAGECPSTTADKNQNIFDSENKCLLPEYKGRTKLIGDIKSKNCTLLIRNIAANEDNIYVRIIALEPYSFKKHTVSISVDGQFKHVTHIPDTFTTFEATTIFERNTTDTTLNSSTPIYVAISVAVVALVIIIILGIGGIVFWKKRKRSRTLIRQHSGYYANFSRTSSNQTKRDASCEKQGKDLSEPKVIDEPIYLNMEAPPEQMDDADNIYANVDYQK